MTSSGQPSDAGRHRLVARLLPVSLLALLAVLPPETRGESLAGVAVLIALAVAVSWDVALDPVARPMLLATAFLAGPLFLTAVAPGAAVEPLVVFFLAAALGTHASIFAESHRDSRILPVALVALGVVVSLWGLQQSLWGLAADAALIEQGARVPDREVVLARLLGGRAFAGFATPAALGGYLAMTLPVAVFLAFGTRGRARIASFIAAGVMAVGVLCTRSVTAAAALCAAYFIYLAVRRRGGRSRVTVVVLSMILLAAAFASRRAEIFDLDRPDSPWRLRAGNFRVAAEVIEQFPWAGAGPGGYGEVYPQYRRDGDNESRHVHNLPLEMMADIGIVPGAAVSALFFWLFLGPLFRIRRDGPPWIDGVGVGLAAFAIQNVADFTAYFPSLLWGAALLRGVVCEPSARRRREHESRRWAAALVLAVTLAAAILAVGVGLSANALHQARMAAARGQHGVAVDLARRAARLAPWSINAHSVAAQALMASGTSVEEWREALAYSQRAIDLSPVRASSRELRARARRRLGDNPGAYADLVEAARLYPLKTRYAEERDRLAASLPANLDPGQP